MRIKFAYLPFLLSLLFAFPSAVSAVPPPDFIFSIGSQIAYVFSFVAVLASAVIGVTYQYLQVKYHAIRVKPWKFLVILLILAAVFIGAAYLYARHRQQVEYEAWLEASDEQADVQEEVEKDEPKIQPEDTEEEPSEELSFFELNRDVSSSITNQEFQAVLDSGRTDFVVLDARENLENSYGHFPDSIHIRYADLLDGLTDELSQDKFIYVLCWSGMRGEEVAQLLRSYGYTAIYLQDGADGWVSDFGGVWEGEIKFSKVYPDSEYGYAYSTEQVRKKVNEGVVLVDAREPEKIASSTIDAYAMPIMYTPSDELEAMYAQIPAGSSVITICDEYINCFMAKIVGVELEIRGHNFLGRYNRPWEY